MREEQPEENRPAGTDQDTAPPLPPTSRFSAPLRAACLEALFLCAAAAAAWWSATDMLKTYGDRVEMRTGVFLCTATPSAMVAVGKGMRAVEAGRFPAVDDFFSIRSSSLDPGAIPRDYPGIDVTGNSYCLMHWHLMRAIGWTWWIMGMSHRALQTLAAFLFAALMMVLYGWSRLGMGRVPALAMTLAMALSPALLAVCASLRDFSKAPFLLGAALLLAHLARRERPPRRQLGWAAALGAVTGIGFGFRQDLMLAVPLAVGAFLFLVPVRKPRAWRTRLALLAVFAAVFAAFGRMPLRGTRLDGGSASAQAFVQGVSEEVESRMGFGNASYVHHYGYSDWLDFSVVNAHARRHGDDSAMEGHFTRGHGRAGQRLAREYCRTFPGDMVSRALTSLWLLPCISAMLDEPYLWYAREPNTDYLKARYDWCRGLAGSAAWWGWPALVAALALLFVSTPRAALLLGGALLLFGVYPSLLFEYRHIFHLSFLPYWAAGMVLFQSLSLALRIRRDAGFRRTAGRRLLVFTGVFLGALTVLLGAQWGARAVQDRMMRGLYERYASAPLDPVPCDRVEENGRALMRPSSALPGLAATATLPAFETAGEYLALEFHGVRGDVPLDIVYADDAVTNFSRSITLPRALFGEKGDGLFFFPVYQLVWPNIADTPLRRGEFRGVSLAGDALQAFAGMSRVRDGRAFSLWPHIVIPADPQAFRPHKTGPLDRLFGAGFSGADTR